MLGSPIEGPDVVVATLAHAQWVRVQQVESRVAVWCAHPPGVVRHGWNGPAAAAHARASAQLHARLLAARELLELAAGVTRLAMVRAGG